MVLPIQSILEQGKMISETKVNTVNSNAPVTDFQATLEAYLNNKPSVVNDRKSESTPTGIYNTNPNYQPKEEQLLVKESDWINLKPEDYSMDKFREKIAYANYLQTLLNPEILPRWVSQPQEGLSSSTDMVAPPSFEKAVGGVTRIDYTRSGKVHTYIPSYQWRKTGDARDDNALGNVYNQQTPWGFRTVFIRDGSNRMPEGFQKDAYEKEITAYLNPKRSANVLAENKPESSPPAELSWQERLVYYDNPALSLLQHLTQSQTIANDVQDNA